MTFIYETAKDYINLAIKKDTVILTGYIEEDNLPKNISYFFDVITSHSLQINDNITDNYLENGTVVNDSTTKSPLIITISGLSAELVYSPSTNDGFLKTLYDKVNDDILGKFKNDYIVTDKLTVIPSILPSVDNITQTAKNAVTVVEDNINRFLKIFNNFVENPQKKITRLEEIFQTLNALREKGKEKGEGLFVQTPYGDFENMFIQNVSLTQSNQRYITDIEITLKQVNFSEVETTKANKETLAKFNEASKKLSSEKSLDNGLVGGKSFLKKLGNNISSFFRK